jgi:hypothetical protein
MSRQAAQLSFIPTGHKFRMSRQAAQLSFIPTGHKFRTSRQAAQLSFNCKRLFALIALAVLFGWAGISQATEKTMAPAFALPDLEGNLVSSASFLGEKPALLMFWATW